MPYCWTEAEVMPGKPVVCEICGNTQSYGAKVYAGYEWTDGAFRGFFVPVPVVCMLCRESLKRDPKVAVSQVGSVTT